MFLWFLWWQKGSMPPLQLWHISETGNRGGGGGGGGTKINFASLIHPQMTKFQKLWVSEHFLYQCIFWLRYNQREVLSFSLQGLLLQYHHTWQYFGSTFSWGQNYTNLCWNPAINENVKATPKCEFENLLHGLPP